MAAKRATKFYLVREVISLFLQMGCELREAEATIHEDGDSFNFRYLIDPETKAFVPVVDLDDSDFISEGEVELWERRLGINIPKGN